MSYLAFDLDALKMTPDAARSAGVSEAELGYGLVRLWSWCWTTKTDRCQPAHLVGFFGGDPKRVAEALVAFEFLAPGAPGEGFRVRGAERYLRVRKAQSEAGKAAVANLRKGTDKPEYEPESPPGSSPAPLRLEPGNTSGLAPALTPNTEHRAPSSEVTTSRAKRPRSVRVQTEATDDAPPSNEYKLLVAALFADFQHARGSEYRPSGRDWKALQKLRADASDEEIRTRWQRGLVGLFKRATDTFAELEAKWNALSTEDTAGNAPRLSERPQQREAASPLDREWLALLEERVPETYLRAQLREFRAVSRDSSGLVVTHDDEFTLKVHAERLASLSVRGVAT